MQIQPSILVVAGSLSLAITLVLAWCLSGVRYLQSGFLKQLFPNYQYLLKSHIDYLMMTGLLMVFFLLFAELRVLGERYCQPVANRPAAAEAAVE